MKKLFVLLTALFTLAQVNAQEKNVIRIATDNTDLILQVAPNGRLYQAYLGDKLLNEKDINNFSPYVKGGSDGSVSTRGWEVYPGSGAEDYFEPAVAITHNDGNPSTILRYVSSEQKAVAGGTECALFNHIKERNCSKAFYIRFRRRCSYRLPPVRKKSSRADWATVRNCSAVTER